MSSGLESRASESKFVPPFQTGDRMSRAEFHALYLQTPESFHAELLFGEVFVASPVSTDHGDYQYRLVDLIAKYRQSTLGMKGSIASTVFLGDEHEVEPDVHFRILEEYGGATRRTDDGYLEGPPELVVEVARTTLSKDRQIKRLAYQDSGVPEYWIINLQDSQFEWFDLSNDVQLELPADGVLKSLQFPGLWIDTVAFWAEDEAQFLATLQQGLASPEHAAFVQLLAAKKLLPPNAGH